MASGDGALTLSLDSMLFMPLQLHGMMIIRMHAPMPLTNVTGVKSARLCVVAQYETRLPS